MVELMSPADTVTTSPCRDVGYSTRGDKPPPSVFHSIATNQSNLSENTFGTSGYHTASSNYSEYSHKSRIVGGGNVKPSMVKPTLIRATLDGAECLADKDCSHTIEKSHEPSLQDDYRDNPNFREVPHKNYNFSS